MADFHAIGGVSATLQTLLLDRMELPENLATPLVPVTTGPPPFSSKDLHPRTETQEDARLNLFLYRVTENGYLQNQEIPGRGTPSAYGHPPLSLNLHYLVTPYGNAADAAEASLFDDSIAQFLLGSAMRVLHDVPIITDKLLTQRPVSGRTILHESLRHEFEQVKLTLEPLTLEDVTKVWTALSLRYRLSAAYVVNVVQIESRRPRRFAKPVGQPISPTIPPLPTDPPSPGPMVYAVTIQTPTIASVSVRRVGTTVEQPFPYANIGDTLILRGTSLAGPVTRVAFGDLVVAATVARGDRVEATIPDDPQLQPGARTVRVIVSDPLIPGRTFTSNDAAFMLAPFVDPGLLSYNSGLRRLTITGSRLIGPQPTGETVIGRSVVDRADYVSTTPANAPPPMTIIVPVPDALPAKLVQAWIGAPLMTDPITGLGQRLDIKIGAAPARTISLAVPPASLAVSDAAAFLAALIHDAGTTAPTLTGFMGAHVAVWRDTGGPRLVIVTGGLRDGVQITGPAAPSLAASLGLTGPNTVAVTQGLLSGELASPPVLSSPAPRLAVSIGGQPPTTLTLPRPTSLASLAADLQAQIRAVGGAAYANALVATAGSQLLVVPGLVVPAPTDPVAFTAVPGDDTTVAELQLNATFAVRVRVNGAESIDIPSAPAIVSLP
jgi:hypothetical protein